ncbi:hypothetical protein NSK_005858 [Nannochloropsis salina CCMP1776]|uniref:Uncharacterized protein n=1 Tax=Nannochloropsis salina CCMP1776 TaxID=1027361 RepID=A0A4D9CU94_9STRA|nr:hypothetical protein NSK_005858 [Nannochloropsis salina CCMP1776]|eukprot:TFJ82851.1 hypothetical protein NSK_005858 [Nannochloropsis salina CCMP1776]
MGESSSSGYIGTGLRDLRPLESPLKVIPYRHVLPTSPHTSHSPLPANDAVPVVERQRQKASPFLKALAGSMGGLVEAIALQPVDTIKTRMQILPTSYPSMIKTAQKIASEESVPALWKGLTPFATHLFSKYALRFGTNAAFQSILTDSETGKLSSSRRLLAGLGAGVTEAILIVTPFDVVKVRLQAQHGMDKANLKYQGPLDAARKIISQEGVGALWSGVTPTIYRNGIQQATMFFLKTWIDDNVLGVQKSLTKDGQETRQPQIWQSMASGFMASCPGLVMTNPLDIVKTRLALQANAGRPVYSGVAHALYTIATKEGVRKLYNGLLPRLLRVPPGMAITWGVSDQLVQWVER